MSQIKLGFTTLITPELTLEDAIPHARRWGYELIEWRIAEPGAPPAIGPVNFWSQNRCSIDPAHVGERLPRLAKLAREAGIECRSCAVNYNCAAIEKIEPVLAAMAAAGVRQVRVNALGYDPAKNYNDLFEASRKDYQRLEKLALKHAVRICMEQHHGLVNPSASACWRMIQGMDPAAIGVIVDTGNVIAEGFEPFGMVLDLLGPYVAEIHVKNGTWHAGDATDAGFRKWNLTWGSVAEGVINHQPLADALRRRNWDGFLVLEDFSNRPMELRMTEGLAALRKIAGR